MTDRKPSSQLGSQWRPRIHSGKDTRQPGLAQKAPISRTVGRLGRRPQLVSRFEFQEFGQPAPRIPCPSAKGSRTPSQSPAMARRRRSGPILRGPSGRRQTSPYESHQTRHQRIGQTDGGKSLDAPAAYGPRSLYLAPPATRPTNPSFLPC